MKEENRRMAFQSNWDLRIEVRWFIGWVKGNVTMEPVCQDKPGPEGNIVGRLKIEIQSFSCCEGHACGLYLLAGLMSMDLRANPYFSGALYSAPQGMRTEFRYTTLNVTIGERCARNLNFLRLTGSERKE